MKALETGNGVRVMNGGLDPQRVSFDKIPIIDLEPMFSGDAAAKERLAEELRKACTEVGFLYIKNHHVSQEIIRKTFDVAEDYFALPDDVKMQNHVSKSRNNRGYAAMLEENTDPTARGDLHQNQPGRIGRPQE